MEGLDPTFAKRVQKGDVIVAGENFGCGSSREHAPIAIKAAGISCVIAASFARIFYRNAFNIGLPAVECSETGNMRAGDHLEFDLARGELRHMESGQVSAIASIPTFMRALIADGGLINHLAKNLPGLRSDDSRDRQTA
jgi:3-isopropylmalate dehydratase small subunit